MASDAGKVGVKYAKALFELCQPAQLGTMKGALFSFCEAWQESPELRGSFSNPGIAAQEKITVLRDIAARLISRSDAVSASNTVLTNFLCVLLVNHRLGLIVDITQAFSGMIDEMNKLLNVEITSARELPEDEKAQVLNRLQRDFGSQAAVIWRVDSDILGGLLVQTGDKLLDSSVRGSLEKIRSKLAA